MNASSSYITNVPKVQQLKHPLTSGRINKVWYIYIVEYYKAVKMNELLVPVTTGINLKIIMLS